MRCSGGRTFRRLWSAAAERSVRRTRGAFSWSARIESIAHVPDILLLPGLGADGRLFRDQAAALPGRILTPPWPSLRPEESLSGFAQRLATSLPAEIPPVIGGASFGGMVALELAAIVRPKAVVLVGSCTGPEAVAPALRALGRFCASVPETLFRPRPWTSPVLLPMFGQLHPAERLLFWEMACGVQPGFLKWGCQAVLSWRPTTHDVPVFHLHGSEDRIIPVQRVRPTQVVQGAAHLLSLSHPVQTSDFLSRIVREAA
jgi:pimeloyl-ACP methyl ester carboxylesterase